MYAKLKSDYMIQVRYGCVRLKHNKAFKSDSQRLAFSLRSSVAKRRSHLNAALVSIYKKSSKAQIQCPEKSALSVQVALFGF